MANIVAPAFQQLQDATGAPYSGGKLNIYQTGTSTPLSLFSDSGLTTATANPVIADAIGVWAPVFVAEAQCKIVVTDSNDVVLYTVDPFYPDGRTDSLAASSITFDGTASGLSATDVQAAIEETITTVSASPTFNDTADATKQLTFDLTGITTSTERTVTWPDGDVTMVAGTVVTSLTTTNVLSDTPINFTVGNTSTEKDIGTITTGTTTPDPHDGQFQTMTNGGASTIAAPTRTGSYSIVIQVTNNASAGDLTFTGFQLDPPAGASLTTTDGHVFRLHITKVGSVSSCTIEALQ